MPFGFFDTLRPTATVLRAPGGKRGKAKRRAQNKQARKQRSRTR